MVDHESSYQKKRLPHSAYDCVRGQDYIPFVSVNEAMPELTVMTVVLGGLLAMIFAATNTYLALQVGVTIAAGIPAAILGTGAMKYIFKKNNILEANMISGIGAMGESVAAGIVFTLPAVIIWGMDLRLSTILLVICLGGLLGILFVVPFRNCLMIEEHGKLAFPESIAAAEVLVSANEGGASFRTVLTGLVVGSFYKLLSAGLLLWSEETEWNIRFRLNGKPFYETLIGVSPLASLAGVGFIVGIEASVYMFAGSLITWFGMIPLIKYLGTELTTPIFPATDLIMNMSPQIIQVNYVRYIGAGALAVGGVIAVAKALPTIMKSLRVTMIGCEKEVKGSRFSKDIPMSWVVGAAVLVFFISWLLPIVGVGFVGASLVVLFSFLFAVVSVRICGIIGATNNPVSGMTISTLLFSTAVLRTVGWVGDKGMLVALMVGAIMCVAVAVAGSAGQVMKTTFIIGGTPKAVQIGMYIGVVFASVSAGTVMILLLHTYGIGSENGLSAPQATLIAMVIKGAMTAQLPWLFVGIGMMIGLLCELFGLPVLTIALGIYLPIQISVGVLIGGLVRMFLNRTFKGNENQQKLQSEKGVLLASGLVAGDAIMGIIVALLATLELSNRYGFGAMASIQGITSNHWTALGVYLLLAYWIYRYSCKLEKKKSE